MKKVLLYILTCVFLFSCQIKEEITFYEDGSGVFTETIDMSAISSLLKMNNSKTSPSKIIDTIFKIDQFLKLDSYKEKLEAKEYEILSKYLTGYTYKMKMDTVDPSFILPNKNFDEITDEMGFGSMSTLSNKISIDKLSEMSSEWKKGTNQELPIQGKMSLESKIPTIYSYTNSIFTRTIDTTYLTDSIASALSGSKMERNFNKDNGYIFEYHFPKPIKSVNQSNYTLSEDKKSIIFYRNLNDKFKNPHLFCFRIELEK